MSLGLQPSVLHETLKGQWFGFVAHFFDLQGLRTLELCVDNLQPDFLYEHIQPVRADLMQALWRTVRNPTDNVSSVAFR